VTYVVDGEFIIYIIFEINKDGVSTFAKSVISLYYQKAFLVYIFKKIKK